MPTIGELARHLGESHRICDSALRSLTASTAMDAAQRALAEVATFEKSSIASLASSLNAISRLDTTSSSVLALTQANASIKSIAESTRSTNTVMRSVTEQERRWHGIAKDIALSGQVAELALKRHTSGMLSASLAAQSKMMHLESYRLGAVIQAAEGFQESLRLRFDKLTTSYYNLFDFIAIRPSTLAGLPPVVTRRPPLEVYREADLLEEITVPEDERAALDEVKIALPSEERSVEDWLCQLDPNLGNLLRGSRAALDESNPDRARHVTTSLRELFTHVLHRLAPDDGVRAWTSDHDFYRNGRPTRQARLLYINRGINIDALTSFVDADVASALTLIDTLHGGTHEITSRLTDRQLQAMVDRMKSLLLFLFRLNATNE